MKEKSNEEELKIDRKIKYIELVRKEREIYTKFMMQKTYFLLIITSFFLLAITNTTDRTLQLIFSGFAIIFSIFTTCSVWISWSKNKKVSKKLYLEKKINARNVECL